MYLYVSSTSIPPQQSCVCAGLRMFHLFVSLYLHVNVCGGKTLLSHPLPLAGTERRVKGIRGREEERRRERGNEFNQPCVKIACRLSWSSRRRGRQQPAEEKRDVCSYAHQREERWDEVRGREGRREGRGGDQGRWGREKMCVHMLIRKCESAKRRWYREDDRRKDTEREYKDRKKAETLKRHTLFKQYCPLLCHSLTSGASLLIKILQLKNGLLTNQITLDKTMFHKRFINFILSLNALQLRTPYNFIHSISHSNFFCCLKGGRERFCCNSWALKVCYECRRDII